MFYEGLRLWQAHLYVCYVSGTLSGGSVSNDAMGKGGSAKERLSRAWGEGGRLDLSCFSGVWDSWEVHLYVFYVSGRSWGAQCLGAL